jgi:beta-lactam-binding protein with PASTA domain
MKFNLPKISQFFIPVHHIRPTTNSVGHTLSSSKKELLWILPFIAFVIGYFCLQFFIAETIVQTPNLVGKDLLHATKMSSELKLNLRIIAEKEIADAQPGTIIKQNPLPNASIKNHQSIFIVITKLPAPVLAPTLLDKNLNQIEKICRDKGIKNRIYYLPTHHPAGNCFAQMPLPGEILEAKKISCYISTGNQSQYLFPDFTDLQLEEVIEFLQLQNIACDVYHKDQKIIAPYKQKFVVLYQKPLAGTLITPSNKLYVQLQVH